jgi:hypothetical protein
VLINLAIAVLNARLYGTLGGSVTSVGAQAEPRAPGSFVGRAQELVELRAGLSDVTAGHSHLFLPSGEGYLTILARFKLKSLRAPKVGSTATAGRVSRNWHCDSTLTRFGNGNQPMVKGRYRWCGVFGLAA